MFSDSSLNSREMKFQSDEGRFAKSKSFKLNSGTVEWISQDKLEVPTPML